MSDVVKEAQQALAMVQALAVACTEHGVDETRDREYIAALIRLAACIPEVIELATEPKISKVDTTHFCGHAPYVCRLPPGHDDLPGGRDPYAIHSDGWLQWWREPGQLGFSFGSGHP